MRALDLLLSYRGFVAANAGALMALLGLRLWLARRRADRIVGYAGSDAVVIRERAGFRELVFVNSTGEMVQARQNRANDLRSGWPYVEGLHVAMLLGSRPSRPERILFLGAGAGLGPRQFEAMYEEAVIDVVDNEPLVVDVAQKFFGLRSSPGLRIIVADAREFVARCPPKAYDVIVVDMYGASGHPAHLVTTEFFGLVREAMRHDGVLVFNLIGNIDSEESVARHVLATLAHAFDGFEIGVFPVPDEVEKRIPLRHGVVRNSIVVVANRIPGLEELLRRAAMIDTDVVPHLADIVRKRRLDGMRGGRILSDEILSGTKWVPIVASPTLGKHWPR